MYEHKLSNVDYTECRKYLSSVAKISQLYMVYMIYIKAHTCKPSNYKQAEILQCITLKTLYIILI